MPPKTITNAPGRYGSKAFTLIELLTVIAIIAILAGMLTPTVTRIIKSARSATTRARIGALSNGLLQYYQDNNNIYPGQTDLGTLTGSQRLAYAMFTVKGGAYTNADDFPKSSYVNYEDGFLDNGSPLRYSGQPNTILDGYKPPSAICYYPSRIGQTGLGQYVYGDNSVYTGSDQGTFNTFITHGALGGPAKDQSFLLIAPGPDGDYFTQDDIKNW